MKKLFILLIFSILLTSCSENTKLENPAKATTKELIDLSVKDTVTYKLISLGANNYLLNTDTQLIEYKFSKKDDFGNVLFLGIVIGFFICIVILGLLS